MFLIVLLREDWHPGGRKILGSTRLVCVLVGGHLVDAETLLDPAGSTRCYGR